MAIRTTINPKNRVQKYILPLIKSFQTNKNIFYRNIFIIPTQNKHQNPPRIINKWGFLSDFFSPSSSTSIQTNAQPA